MTESAVACRCLPDVNQVEGSNPPPRPWRNWNVPPPEKRIEDSIPTLRPGQKWVAPFVPPPRPKGRRLIDGSEECERFKAMVRRRALAERARPATSEKSPPVVEDLKKVNKEQTMKYGTIALDHYNATTEGPTYELVEPFATSPILGGSLWYHVCFTAKPKPADASADSSPKHFFAEIALHIGEEMTVSCQIVDLDSSDTVDGCRVCPPNFKMYHPKDGFEAGRTWK